MAGLHPNVPDVGLALRHLLWDQCQLLMLTGVYCNMPHQPARNDITPLTAMKALHLLQLHSQPLHCASGDLLAWP